MRHAFLVAIGFLGLVYASAASASQASPIREQSWITISDIPDNLRADDGVYRLKYSLIISPNGKVDTCVVDTTSGRPAFDEFFCQHITRNARFSNSRFRHVFEGDLNLTQQIDGYKDGDTLRVAQSSSLPTVFYSFDVPELFQHAWSVWKAQLPSNRREELAEIVGTAQSSEQSWIKIGSYDYIYWHSEDTRRSGVGFYLILNTDEDAMAVAWNKNDVDLPIIGSAGHPSLEKKCLDLLVEANGDYDALQSCASLQDETSFEDESR